jgi:hypothetical protein
MEPLGAAGFEQGLMHQALHRRSLLRAGAALSGGLLGCGLSWLTPVAHLLAREAERRPRNAPAQSLILLWMAGGPSQLETFDPHPGKKIAGETKAIETAVRGIQLAEGMNHVAEQMGSIALIRSLVSKEGDHERGTYMLKTGYRPDPTVVHPSIGAICCHQLPRGTTDIPRHVSILPGQWPGRGGMLGNDLDAFKTYDPLQRVPDVSSRVSDSRFDRRLEDLAVVEQAFARGRGRQVDATQHHVTMENARKMMGSEQLKAFDVSLESASVRDRYGNTPFGRGCLAARRLIEQGVRCVEVTLEGWDSHVNNHETQRARVDTLDPAFAALIAELRERDLLDQTIVVCAGEFGRTPSINRLEGRDHWPGGFSMALAGGRIAVGQKPLGETDPDGKRLTLEQGISVPDVHATILSALGIDPQHEELAPVGRPIKFSEGTPIKALLKDA